MKRRFVGFLMTFAMLTMLIVPLSSALAADEDSFITFSGVVWNDEYYDDHTSAHNGLRESTESFRPRHYIRIYKDNIYIGFVRTDSNGAWSYQVSGVNGTTATYKITVEKILTYTDTFSPQNVGSDDTIDSDVDEWGSVTQEVTFSDSSSPEYKFDAGVFYTAPAPATIGVSGIVWNDVNQNGQRESGEPLLQGAQVKIYRYGSLYRTVTTNSSGYWSFNDAEDGGAQITYTFTVILPTGYDTFTLQNVGSDTTDSDVNATTGSVSLAVEYPDPGYSQDYKLDAGVYLSAAIPTPQPPTVYFSGVVWSDANANGQRDAGEILFTGVTIYIAVAGGISTSVTTGAGGAWSYALTGQDGASADVTFSLTPPSIRALTAQNVGDDSTDSDFDQSTKSVTQSVVFSAAGSSSYVLDAGYILASQVTPTPSFTPTPTPLATPTPIPSSTAVTTATPDPSAKIIPQTGDHSNVLPLIAVLVVSTSLLAGIMIYRRVVLRNDKPTK